MHVALARCPLQGNLTPIGGREGIVFLIHCLLLQQLTVISPACWVTPVMLLILLLTRVSSSSLHTCGIHSAALLAVIKMIQLLYRRKTGEKLGCVLYKMLHCNRIPN